MSSLSKILIGVVIGLVLVLGWTIARNQSLQHSNNNWKHNYEVVQDSMHVIETKYGETLYENGSLIIEKKELEDALNISQKQVKEYEKKLGSSLAYISKLETQLKIKDTVRVTEVVYDTLSRSYSMYYNDSWLGFRETLKLANKEEPVLDVYDIWMDVPLVVGISDDYKIFITSPNPYFMATSIEGAVIDKSKFAQKKPRWTLSVYGGFGAQYGLLKKEIDVGPQVGVGIGFRIF